jgi:hypothetical protein
MFHGYLPYLISNFVHWAPALVIAVPALGLFAWHLRIQGQRNEALRKVSEMEERLAQMEDAMSKVGGEIEKLTDDQRFTTRLLLGRDSGVPSMKD